jgi:hypothetical protein
MKKAIALVGALVLSLALFSNGEAQQNAMKPTPIVEINACNFRDNMDMGDVRAAATRFNAWADRHTVKDYTAFMATPFVFSADLTYDTLWIGASPNGAAMGAGETLYMTQGQEVASAFESALDCSSRALYAEVVQRRPAGPPPANGVALFSDCKVHDGRTVPEALDAIKKYADDAASHGSDMFVAALFPLGGQTNDADFDFKVVEGYGSMQAFGEAIDVYTGGGFLRAEELLARLVDCNSPRVYTLERVRQAAEAPTD